MYPYFYFFGQIVSAYWLLVTVGIAFALLLALIRRRAARFDVSTEDVIFTMIFCVAGAFVGAKMMQIIGFIYSRCYYTWVLDFAKLVEYDTRCRCFLWGLNRWFFAGLIYIRKFIIISLT